MGALGLFSRPSIRVMGPEALRGSEGKIEDMEDRRCDRIYDQRYEDMIKDIISDNNRGNNRG
jgi:hypothetical protein